MNGVFFFTKLCLAAKLRYTKRNMSDNPYTIWNRVKRLVRSKVQNPDNPFANPRTKADEEWKKYWDDADSGYRSSEENSSDFRANAGSDKRKIASHYKVLELEEGASWDEVREAYRRLIKTYHPDKFGLDPEKQEAANEIMQGLNEAYAALEEHLNPS